MVKQAKTPRRHDVTLNRRDPHPRLRVKSFGPIRECELPVQDLIVFIGEQASGKSTIAKLLYFFQSVPDVLEENTSRLRAGPALQSWVKLVRERFMDSFGTTKHLPSFEIEYHYAAGVRLRLTQEKKSGRLRVEPDARLWTAVEELIESANATGSGRGQEASDPLRSSMAGDEDAEQAAARENLRRLTGCEAARVFVPAARSLLSVLSTDLLYEGVSSLDPLMRQFVRRIARLQQGFARSLEEQLENALHASLRDVPVDEPRVQAAIRILHTILKGSYVYDRGKERIELPDGQQVHLRFASSGQQESLWILLLVFSVILHSTPTTLIIEEPEAHLFPLAQRDMVELIALCKNMTPAPGAPNNGAVMTTHSPYVLASLNNLLYAHQVGSRGPDAEREASRVIDKQLWINPDDAGVWFVEGGATRSIVDPELRLIQAEEIDGASSELRSTFDALAEIEAQ